MRARQQAREEEEERREDKESHEDKENEHVSSPCKHGSNSRSSGKRRRSRMVVEEEGEEGGMASVVVNLESVLEKEDEEAAIKAEQGELNTIYTVILSLAVQ